jgi:xanthine dehydrogenase FAD-binding subunit
LLIDGYNYAYIDRRLPHRQPGRYTLQDFDYVAAQSVVEVIDLLEKGGEQSRVLVGGTDLLVQLREGRRSARLVVDIKRVPEVTELKYEDGAGLLIGAAVTCAHFCSDPQVAAMYPGLVDAVSVIGGTQIQGRASIGGNLCNASPAADAAPALIVHRAVCLIASKMGQREIPLESFFSGPGRSVLTPGELLVAVRVPTPQAGFGAKYLRFIPRNEMDIAVVGAGAAVWLSDDGQQIQSARLSLGAVAPTPLLVTAVEEFLSGREVLPENLRQAALLARDAARPISDMRGTIEQRRHLTGVLARRALEGAVERARAGLRVEA